MKKLMTILLMLLAINIVAQENIVGYEWWLAGDDQNVTYIPITPVAELDDEMPFDLSQLNPGRYQVFFRFRSTSGKWSPVFQSRFTKTPEDSDLTLISAFQYWSDADSTDIITVELDEPVNELNDTINLDLSNFPTGKQTIYLRYKDSNGQWSSVKSQGIVKTPEGDANVHIAAYEYWFNNDQENSIWKFFDHKPSEIDSILPLDLVSLDDGGHVVSLRFFNNLGQASFIHRSFVKKLPVGFEQNQLIAYRYWFNEDTETLIRSNFPESMETQETSISLSLNQFNPGDTVLVSFQFLDILGQWSAIHTDTVKIYDGTHVNHLSSSSTDILLYPNPARNMVYVELQGPNVNSSTILNIFDVNGKSMLRREIVIPDGNMIQLNLEGLVKGVYFVVIDTSGNRNSKRLIVLE